MDRLEFCGIVAELVRGMGIGPKDAFCPVFGDQGKEILGRINPSLVFPDKPFSVADTGEIDFQGDIVGDAAFNHLPGHLPAIGIEVVDGGKEIVRMGENGKHACRKSLLGEIAVKEQLTGVRDVGKVGVDFLVFPQGGMVSEDQIVQNAAIEQFAVIREIHREAFGLETKENFDLILVFLFQGIDRIAVTLKQGIVTTLVRLRKIRKHGVIRKAEGSEALADGFQDIVFVLAGGMTTPFRVGMIIAAEHFQIV